MPTHNPACARTPIRITAALVASLAVTSCGGLPSHFHDENAAALSKQLQTDFAAYREDQASLYTNMAANLAVFEAEEDALIGGLMANYGRAITNITPDLNGHQLRSRIALVGGELEAVESRIEDEIKKVLSDRARAQLEAGNAAAAIEELKTEIKQKEDEAKAWQENITNFQDAIAALPATLSGLSAAAGDITALLEGRSAGTSGTLPAAVLDQIKSALDTVPDSVRKAVAADIGDAPGITVRILQLGLDLARLNKERAESELARLEEQQRVLQEAYAETQIARALLAQANNSAIAQTLPDGKLIVDEIEDFRTSSQSTHNKVYSITGALQPLRTYTTAAWLVAYQDTMVPLRVARLRHQGSIAGSEINDRSRQAVIAAGLDGLARYHEGGLTTDDIRTIISLAQSIAVYFIAF